MKPVLGMSDFLASLPHELLFGMGAAVGTAIALVIFKLVTGFDSKVRGIVNSQLASMLLTLTESQIKVTQAIENTNRNALTAIRTISDIERDIREVRKELDDLQKRLESER